MPESAVDEPFVAYLEGLRDRWQGGRKPMAALRGVVGVRFQDAPIQVLTAYILPWCGKTPNYWPDQCRLTLAALFASHQISWEHEEGEGPTNLGASLARLRRTGVGQQVDKQLGALLLARRETLGHHLGAPIRLLAKAEIPVDWSQLFRDTLGWWPEKGAARRWARAYYGLQEGHQEEESD